MANNKSVKILMEEVEKDPRLTAKIDELRTLYTSLIKSKGIEEHKSFEKYCETRAAEYENLGGSQDTLLSIPLSLWFEDH